MVDDKVRNLAFKAAIDQLKTQNGDWWLEIGCGAYLCLTKLVIEAHCEIKILAIEANEKACADAIQLAKEHNFLPQLQVQNVRSDQLDHSVDFVVVLSELIGNIASQEGAPVFLQQYTGKLQVPRYAATFFAPCSLSNVIENATHSSCVYDCSSFMMIDSDLSKCTFSSNWEPAEHFDFHTGKYSAKKQDCLFEIIEDGTVDCFGLFVWVGFCGYDHKKPISVLNKTAFPYKSNLQFDTEPTHSFSSLRNDSATASNWFNVIVKFDKPVTVQKGQKLNVTSTFEYDKRTTDGKLIPSYHFQVGEQVLDIPFSHFGQDYNKIQA